FQQLTQENAAALQWKPDGPAEKVMESGESGFITQAEQGQEGRDGALAGGKDGPDKQGLSSDPGGLGKHLGKRGDNIGEPFWDFEHLQMVSGGAEISLSAA
ncbi:hypothetical protein, partial [Deinococcus marmoris]